MLTDYRAPAPAYKLLRSGSAAARVACMQISLPLKLTRPLATFDIESTGTSPRADRIIDLAIIVLSPEGDLTSHVFRVNPGIPIPAEASAIHGICDADVADAPPFSQIASQVAEVLEGCDLAGFNHIRFDVPMLIEEFTRAGIPLDIEGKCMIDAQRIFHRREPRDLTAALAFFCDDEHADAHGAEADAMATLRVLEGQFRKYPDLPRDPDELDRYCSPIDPSWVERTGRLRWVSGEITINFGKKKGTPLRDLVLSDRGFLKWILKSDFSQEVRQIVADAMDGKWPVPPDESPQPHCSPGD